jgi:hypothetical protein
VNLIQLIDFGGEASVIVNGSVVIEIAGDCYLQDAKHYASEIYSALLYANKPVGYIEEQPPQEVSPYRVFRPNIISNDTFVNRPDGGLSFGHALWSRSGVGMVEDKRLP